MQNIFAFEEKTVFHLINKHFVSSDGALKSLSFLSLNLPHNPLFKDAVDGGSIIPQVPLFSLLQKFDGRTPEVLCSGRSTSVSTICERFLLTCICSTVCRQIIRSK